MGAIFSYLDLSWLRSTETYFQFQIAVQAVLHFSQSFPTKVVQNDLECLILAILHFFQSFPTKMVQNDSECPILVVPHFSPSFTHQSGPELFAMPNFGHFALFSNLFASKQSKNEKNYSTCGFISEG